MNRMRTLARLTLPFALALACGDDDGHDDTAAGTTVTNPGSDGTGASETTDAAASGEESTGAPAECEALMCSETELCVSPGTCGDAPFCIAADMVPCDFGSGLCNVADVCSGMIRSGALVCETCL